MIVLGVNFLEGEVVKWKRKAFVDAHKDILFTDMPIGDREKILGDTWDEIKAAKKGKVG